MRGHALRRRGMMGFALLLLLFCAFGYLVAPHDPRTVNLSARLLPPDALYPFGTDTMGRCVLSRLLYGGQTTLGIVLLSGVVILLCGIPLGLVMGTLKRGALMSVLESVLNAVTSMPPIAYLIVFIGTWGNSIVTMLVALTLSLVLRIIKLVKAQTEVEREKAYVLCAVSSGAGQTRVLFAHILPNIIKESLVFLSLSCADMIVMITSFSFIGLGLGDSAIDWGSMIQQGQNVSMIRPDLIVYPMLFAFMCTLAFNLLAAEMTKSRLG